MDKVVKWKRPACVEDSNEANKTKNPSTSTPVSDSQKYMVSSGDEINRLSRPFANPEYCILHFYLSVDDRGALFAIKNVVSTRIKYITKSWRNSANAMYILY